MKNQERKLKQLANYFVVIGLLEIFLWSLLFSNILFMLIGVITVVPAYIAAKEKKFKINYFIAIWSFIKYNPSTLILLAFAFSDLASTANEVVYYLCLVLAGIIYISSIALGIILLIKTSKYYKKK